ncbi:PREDICTED: exocyst complex component 2 [Papilio polytes]|uniref:exocyst complex component 2 n=1 Tax=Papilio polytes TaxID=76194 RepID=UPI000675E902|nr:PREDICTED: exocyst complex component 2 [Papilio polytes]
MGPPPVVTGISPKEGPPGTRVTIRGEFLGISVTDLIGLKICGCDCLLSAEWKSKNKIVARSGPCKGRGDIIVTTKSGGEGTSTVQFRGYHESVGPMKESAVWVEEAAPPSLPWGRRPMSPTAYTPPDPLGLSTEGDDCKFPEEELHELFPDGSGKLSDENFQPGWYLLEHHSNTSYEDLKAGMVFLQRKVEGQKEGQLSFLKANTGAVMDQLDRLVLLKNMYEEDQRKNGREPLPSLQSAIEESISLADSLFSEILSRKENADKTREALSLLTRHKFLFQLPSSIDKNIKKKEYDLVVNDYTRAKNLFGNTDVKLFQKILSEIDKKIEDLKENLYNRMKTMPINVQEQTKYIRLLISLNWDGDAAWTAILSRKDYLMNLMNKVKEHFKKKEEQESNEKGRRKARESECECLWSATRAAWCGAACGALASELHALWPLARRYFAGELAGQPTLPQRHTDLKEMIIAMVESFSEQMRGCLICTSGGGGGGAAVAADVLRARLLANLRHLRDAYDSLLKLDLPSQPLSIINFICSYDMPKPMQAIQATKDELSALEDNIADMYLEYKGDPLVGTIEPSMYMGRHHTDGDTALEDARPYVYEIINNLIAVHAEVDSVCGAASSRYVRDICETVCEELARLAACAPARGRAALQARLEYSLLRLAVAHHLTRKAENYLMEALAGLPPLDNEDDKKKMDEIIQGFKKRMELQLASLNCNMETV